MLNIDLDHRLTINIEEMGMALGISRRFAYELAQEPGFPIVRIGRRKLVNLKALQAWLDKQGGGAPGEDADN